MGPRIISWLSGNFSPNQQKFEKKIIWIFFTQIALDNQYSSEDTRILFCTTGLLLEKLIQSKTMSNFTHIILDEVHERDKNMDFLFIVVRMLLSTNSPNVKVILMSATIEAPKVCMYIRRNKLFSCHSINALLFNSLQNISRCLSIAN